MLHPDTRAAVAASGLPWQLCEIDRGDRTGYARLLARRWRYRETFVNVEHDIVPTRAQLDEIAHCGHDWCVFEYDDGLSPGSPKLGLARFGKQLLCDQPGLAERALRVSAYDDRYRDWTDVDVRLVRELSILGYRPAVHGPPVRHLNGGAQVA